MIPPLKTSYNVCPKCGLWKKRESRQCIDCRFPRPSVIQPDDPAMRFVPLTQEKIAVVDQEDYEWICKFRWQARFNPTSGLWYAVRSQRIGDKNTSFQMHREIMGLSSKDKRTVDHIEPTLTLDNRKSNLRIATLSEQGRNKRKSKANTSGFKGVSFDTQMRKFRAYICLNRKLKHLGFFDSAIIAHAAYVEASKIYHGEFARTD